jgi:hypothetical protein
MASRLTYCLLPSSNWLVLSGYALQRTSGAGGCRFFMIFLAICIENSLCLLARRFLKTQVTIH